MRQQRPKTKLFTVHHPDLDEVWICSTQEKCIEFVEKNEHVWAKYRMDSDLFRINPAYVRDTKLADVIFDNLPELYL